MKAVAKASEAKAAATKKAGADMAQAAEKSEAKQGDDRNARGCCDSLSPPQL